MNSIYKKIFLIPVLIALFLIPLFSQDADTKEQALTRIVMETLGKNHYSHPKINQAFSKKVYDLYIKTLDYNKRFFRASDITDLQKYQNSIDKEFKEEKFNFYSLSTNLFLQRISEVRGMISNLQKTPFDFTQDESLQLDAEKREYTKTKDEQKELWRKILKYETLLRYIEYSGTNQTKKAFVYQPSLEKRARTEASKSLDKALDRLLKEKPEERFNRYLNAFASSFDPHTEYFPPAEKEDFDIHMSGTFEGIGAVLKEDGEYIKIQDIIPGGAAWREKELQTGDIILKVGQASKEPVDIINMPVTEAVKLIRGKKGTEVKLTVRKADGRVMTIALVRDTVVLEESYAKSALINDKKDNKLFGYIFLPAFYHDFKKSGARNASDDVKEELRKLKQEKVEGMILDLRNNGGGALDDAIRMSGLFIESGPIVQVKNSDGSIDTFTDPDDGIECEVPLVILVNELSASASEILSAALQDYGRAVIVGSSQTFGKGTVQTFADLDKMYFFSPFKPLGSLKLTLQKFYRVNGGSTQSKGVASDIVLPDMYSFIDIGEKKLDYSLPWDTIGAAQYEKWNGKKPDLGYLKNQSKKRVDSSTAFNMVNSNLVMYKIQNDQPKTLQLKKNIAEQNKANEQAALLDNLDSKETNIIVTAPKEDQTNDDEAAIKKRNDWLKSIHHDIYVHEAVNILNDWISK